MVEGRWFKGLRLRVEGIEIKGVSERERDLREGEGVGGRDLREIEGRGFKGLGFKG